MSDSVTSDIDVNQGLSVVQVSLASPTLQVQSVIQPNQQILQSASQNSVIQTAGSNVPTIQVVRVCLNLLFSAFFFHWDFFQYFRNMTYTHGI